jgi:chromate transporter
LAEQAAGAMNDTARDPAAAIAPVAAPSFDEAFRVWLKIGFVNFGGPAGQIALMHKILVEEKRWIDETRFLHALNYCMLLPGPEAQQLATYVGWLFHGVRGGLVAGTLFVLPGFVVLLALSTAYLTLGDLSFVQGLLFGLKAAVLALVTEALLRVSKRALKSQAMWAVAIAAFIAIAFLHVPFPLIILAAAAAGLVISNGVAAPSLTGQQETASGTASVSALAKTVLIWGAVWLAPVALIALAAGPGHVFTQVALFFSKVAAVTFGGAYAVLAYVAQQAVDTYGWLSPGEMLTGLGLAETTPGPVILVLIFVGFLAGARGTTGLDPILAGVIGGIITLWVTFAPSFLFIFVGAPYIERLRGNRHVAGALAAVTAAVVGVIANLALWFGLHVLFGTITEASYGPVSLPAPDISAFDWIAALIAVAAGIALIRFHANVLIVLALSAIAGASWVVAR